MKLSNYGYHANEQTIHGYCMQMGELKLLIIQKLTEKAKTDIRIRIVHAGDGEVDEYENLNDFISHDFNNRWDIMVYNMHIQHSNVTNEDYFVAVIADDEAED